MISAERMKSVLIAPATFLVLERLRIEAGRLDLLLMLMRGMREDEFVEFLRTLVAEIEPTEHEERDDHLRQQQAEHKGDRQEDEQLVLQRAESDLPDDRQLSGRGKAGDVARRDGRVVDDDARGLGAGLHRLARHIVQRCGRRLGERGDVVEKGDQANAHKLLRFVDGQRIRPRASRRDILSRILAALPASRPCLTKPSTDQQSGLCVSSSSAVTRRLECQIKSVS